MDAKVTPNCGEVLQQERMAQGISIEQVANDLRLPKERILEIENHEFQESISSTFYRGYIRSYAQRLKIDAEPLLESFNAIFADENQLRAINRLGGSSPTRREMRSDSHLFKWISFVVIAAIILTVGWGLKERFFSNNPSNNETEDSASIRLDMEITSSNNGQTSAVDVTENQPTLTTKDRATDNNTVQERVNLTLNNNAESNQPSVDSESSVSGSNLPNKDIEKTVVDNETLAKQVVASNTKPAGELSSIVFTFVGDCWVEIKDATGERLAYGIKKNGKVMSLEGVAPYQVKLGDPSVVRVLFNGSSVDLSDYRAGRPATLVVE